MPLPRTPSAPTTLFLVRHGETEWHAENRYAGAESDIDLTGRGHDQAQRLARWAATARLDQLVVSPVRRARETAEPAAVSTGLHAQVEQELREVDFGVAEGRTKAELEETDPESLARFRDDPAAHPFPGSEPPASAARRGAACLRRVAERHPGQRVLVVAHNSLIRLALCALLELPVGRYRQVFPTLENAALCELQIDPTTGATALVRLNAPPIPELETRPIHPSTTPEEAR